jgi:hypothetical protein
MTTLALEGTGASIAMSVSSFTADLISLSLPELSVEAMDTTHLGTVGAKTKKVAKLYEIGAISAEFDHNPASPSMKGVQQNFTISWPLQTGQTTPYKRIYPGFVSSEGGEEMTVDNLMRSKVTITVTGAMTEVAAT